MRVSYILSFLLGAVQDLNLDGLLNFINFKSLEQIVALTVKMAWGKLLWYCLHQSYSKSV